MAIWPPMPDPREVEFAGCLLDIGGPPRPMEKKENGILISTTGYMFAAQFWYRNNIKPSPTATGEFSMFTGWWTDYKYWLEENRHG